MSFIEAIANVGVGYMIAVVAQMLVFPLFGLTITLLQNLQIGLIFTGISIARSFVLRRLFEAARERRSDKNRSGKSCSYSRASANEIAAFNERAVAVKE